MILKKAYVCNSTTDIISGFVNMDEENIISFLRTVKVKKD